MSHTQAINAISEAVASTTRHVRNADSHATPMYEGFPIEIQTVKWSFRVIPNSRSGRHRTGYVVTWPRQPLLRCESELERHCIHSLAADRRCVAIATQPITVWYRWNGRNFRYTPDILAIFTNGQAKPPTVRLIEVKPLARFSAVRAKLVRHAAGLNQAVAIPLSVMTQMPDGAIAEVTP